MCSVCESRPYRAEYISALSRSSDFFDDVSVTFISCPLSTLSFLSASDLQICSFLHVEVTNNHFCSFVCNYFCSFVCVLLIRVRNCSHCTIPYATIAEDSHQKPKGRKKTTKPHPPDLALLTDDDRQKFTLAIEIDPNQKSKGFGKEFMAAQSVCIQPASADEHPVVYNLKQLLVEHVRKLCSNLGITSNCGLQNNFNCRKAIATYFRYEDALDVTGMKPTSHASASNAHKHCMLGYQCHFQ